MKTRLRYCLMTLMAFAFAGTAVAQLPVDEIRARALDALTSNSKQIKNILWEGQRWSEFSGHGSGILGSSEEIQTKTPILRSHLEMVGDKPTDVLDGWEDQPPLSPRFPMQKRISLGRGVIDRDDLTREFLGENRRFVLLNMKTDRDRRAYVILSRPPESLPSDLRGMARCAAAMNATLIIDLNSLFPIRVDARVVTPHMCQGEGFLLDAADATLQYHYVRVRGKARCGTVHEIYASNLTVQTGTLTTDGVIMGSGSVAERSFLLGPNYWRGVFKQLEARGKFRIFVTSVCFPGQQDAPADDAKGRYSQSQPPIDFFEVESYFNLEGFPVPPVASSNAENATGPLVQSTQVTGGTALARTENPAIPSSAPAHPFLRRALRPATPRNNRDPGDFWGSSGDWDWRPKGVYAQGFEGTRFGVGGDYFLPPTLKIAVIENGRQIYQLGAGYDRVTYIVKNNLTRELLKKRVSEAFGDGALSPERLASILLAVSVTQDTHSSGVVLFHWKYEWNFARILAPEQRDLAEKFWRANFLADSPPQPAMSAGAISGGLNSQRRDEVGDALRNGCVDPNVAASAFLSYALGDNKFPFGQVELEVSRVTPGMIFFHLSADRSNADKLAYGIYKKIGTTAYTDVDENNNVIGSSLYGEGRPLANYVRSYYHGELCGRY